MGCCCESSSTKKLPPLTEIKPVVPPCCCAAQSQGTHFESNVSKGWATSYFFLLMVGAIVWYLAYISVETAARWVVYTLIGLEVNSALSASLEFFLYDTVKILLLLIALIYGIAWVRVSLKIERIRAYLSGKRRGLGYFLGALFGAVTPFCSCSSVPLFLGFTSAGVPIGITMSFLITSPLINEIAVILLWSLLGWKLTGVYIGAGMIAGILGGLVMDSMRAERFLQPFVREAVQKPHARNGRREVGKLTILQRHIFAWHEMTGIFKRVWKWVIVGVGIGAVLHGFVPENWFAEHFSAGQWWTVPSAVLSGIPLYSNVTGIVPIMESLLVKGLPVGTTLAFCMSAVVASIPEVIMLRQIMTIKLQVIFIGYLWIVFTVVGLVCNSLQADIL